MAREKYDPHRIMWIGKRHRKASYLTENGHWHICCDIRQLPGGLFRSGEVWRSAERKEYPGTYRWRRFASWDYDLERQDRMRFLKARANVPGYVNVPEYVRVICEEVGLLLANKYPVRGLGVGSEEVLSE